MKCAFCELPCHPADDSEVPLPNSKRKVWVHKMCHMQWLSDRWSEEIDRQMIG